MNILVTGSKGFIAKNLIFRLKENKYNVIEFVKGESISSLKIKIKHADIVFHLAGENRSDDYDSFTNNNEKLTENICKFIKEKNKNTPIIFSSSIHANQDSPYGVSKRNAEILLKELKRETGNTIRIYQLPGVFGKWSKPFYNSVVSTFCYSIANDLDIKINDPEKKIKLIYIDDLIDNFIISIKNLDSKSTFFEVTPNYEISVGNLSEVIKNFKESRKNLVIQKVGKGLIKKLYSTYLSYLPIDKSHYLLSSHKDKRGEFVEILKTIDSGQFSFFTAKAGISRGGHYHHSKCEKFLLVKGKAKFKHINVITKEFKEVFISADNPTIVESIPGWSHNITNIGEEEMIVILWANESFDKNKPDTHYFEM